MNSSTLQHEMVNRPRYLTTVNLVTVLLFLFPVFAVGVKSWTSTLHVFLFFISMYWLFRYRQQLAYPWSLPAKSFLLVLVLVLLFAWYLIVEYLNGGGVKTHWPWIEFRYLMAVPILIMLGNLPQMHIWLVRGAILGSMYAVGVAFYQTSMLNIPAMGEYHHLFLGPAASMMGLLILYSEPFGWESKPWKILAFLGFICAMVALVLSTARSGLLATTILLMLYPLISGRLSLVKVAVIFSGVLATFIALYFAFNPFKHEVDQTVNSLQAHFKQRSMSKEEYFSQNLNNITVRFEMWRAAWTISQYHPVIGVGRSGYGRLLNELVDKGEIHPQTRGQVQPHNAFLYHLVTRGYPGLILFLFLFIVSFAIFYKYRAKDDRAAILGISFVLFFAVVSLTQSSVFLRGHYLSYFLVCLSVLLADSLRGAQVSKSADDSEKY